MLVQARGAPPFTPPRLRLNAATDRHDRLPCRARSPYSEGDLSRRAIVACLVALPLEAKAAPLAPLGGVVKDYGGSKDRNLPIEEIKERLRRGLGVDEYFVTGRIPAEIFDDACRFVDPTNDVTGLSRYVTCVMRFV